MFVIAMQEVVLRLHTLPSLDLFLTIQYGTPIFLQRAGRNITSSMGSTSLAMTTSWAFFFSIRVVTVLTPWRTTGALLLGASSFPSALAAALALSLSFLACLVSGRYLSRSLNNCIASVALQAISSRLCRHCSERAHGNAVIATFNMS